MKKRLKKPTILQQVRNLAQECAAMRASCRILARRLDEVIEYVRRESSKPVASRVSDLQRRTTDRFAVLDSELKRMARELEAMPAPRDIIHAIIRGLMEMTDNTREATKAD